VTCPDYLGPDMDVLRQILCARCRTTFYMCRSCYRGHKYCSDVCRLEARNHQLKAARKRHRQSPEGRLDHRDQMRRLRAVWKTKSKAVVDQTSPDLPARVSLDSDGHAPRKSIGVALACTVAAAQSVSQENDHVESVVCALRCCSCGLVSEYIVPFEWPYRLRLRPGRPP
jgi:hypothetical protein